jgi:hypothetical protein
MSLDPEEYYKIFLPGLVYNFILYSSGLSGEVVQPLYLASFPGPTFYYCRGWCTKFAIIAITWVWSWRQNILQGESRVLEWLK